MFRQEEKYGPRLTLILCYMSSEDDSRPREALRFHTRTSCGWQSAKHCAYPQELGFRFEGMVSLDSLRLLVHECKIPSCVEISVAAPTQEEIQKGICSPYEEASFSLLGHSRFSTNEVNLFRARELKAVKVGRQCTYLRLIFRRPHHNGYNLFHQIGLVAMTAHGSVVRHLNYPATGNVGPIVVGEVAETPLDEMMPLTSEEANTANYDAAPGTATDIENLQRWKAHAVAEEDYDLAAALKAQIDKLQNNVPQIARLESEKRAAAEAEDYVRAKELKKQIDVLRGYDVPESTTPLRRATAPTPKVNGSQPVSAEGSAPSPPSAPRSAGASPQPPRRAAAPLAHQSEPDAYDEQTVGGKGFYDVDNAKDPFGPQGGTNARDQAGGRGGRSSSGSGEVTIDGDGEPWERQLNAAIEKFITDKSAPTALSGDAAQDAKEFEKAFGVYCAACLFAKRGQLREAAIRGLTSKSGYRAAATHAPSVVETLLGYLMLKGRGVSDPVAGAVFASCEAIQKIVEGRLEGEGVPSAAGVAGSVAKLTSELVARLGDTNNRIRENVEDTLLSIARSPIGPDRIVALLMVDPDKEAKKAASYRAHLARVNLISSFVDVYGVRRASPSPHALDTNQVMVQVVLPSLQHANNDVREAATKLFAKLLYHDRATAKPHLANLKLAQQALVDEQLHLLTSDESAPMERAPPRHQRSPSTSQLSSSDPHPTSSPRSPRPPPQRQQQQQQQQQRRPSPMLDVESETQSVARSLPFSSNAGEDRPSKNLPPLEPTSSRGEQEFRSSRTCPFCGKFNSNFTESQLDTHYVRACPMLCPCPLCDQVTEICTLQQHLVSECEFSHMVRECPRCREAVRAEFFKRHVASQTCIESVAGVSVCPLCHAEFKGGMDGWRKHLATAPGCANNPRKFDGSGPVMQ